MAGKLKLIFIPFLTLIYSIALFAGGSKYEKYYTDSCKYDVKFYFLNLSFNDSDTYIKGYTTVKAQALEDISNFFIEFSDYLHIDSIISNSKKLKYSRNEGMLKIIMPETVNSGSLFDVTVYYRGHAQSVSPFGGIMNRTDNTYNFKVTATLSEPFYSSDWFPCKQELTDKIDSVYCYLTVPSDKKAGSNGLLKKVVNLPGNNVQYQWQTHYPIAFYLISVAVSDYREYNYYVKSSLSTDSFLYQNFIYNTPQCYTESKPGIDKTVDIIHFFESILGPFPFIKEKYGHAMANIGGGMENQTITTLNDFEFSLVAHELAHSWFGDFVTCSDWQNIWINEGFASYLEYLAIEKFKSRQDADNWLLQAQQTALQAENGSVFVPIGDKLNDNRIFSTQLTYKKGALILHTIRKQMQNDTLFFYALKTFLQKYAFKNATAEDFKQHLYDITKVDYTDFFAQWYYGIGFPDYTISWNYRKDTLYIESFEKGSDVGSPFFKINMAYKLHFYLGKDSIIYISQNSALEKFKFYMPRTVKSIEVDPDNVYLKKLSISKKSMFSNETAIIYPNPCTDSLSVEFKDEKDYRIVEVYNYNGKKLLSQYAFSNPYNIDLKTIAQGAYILRIIDPESVYLMKFIKD